MIKLNFKIFITILFFSIFFSCSSIDLIYWGTKKVINRKINEQVELDQKQKKQVGEDVANFLTWHKTNQLKKYRNLLIDFKRNLEKEQYPYPEEKIKNYLEPFFKLVEEEPNILARQIIPKLVILFSTLTDKQINELAKKIKTPSENSKKYYALNEKELNDRRLSIFLKVFDFLEIEFNPKQKEIIRQKQENLNFIDNRKYWKKRSEDSRQEFIAALKSRDEERMLAFLKKLINFSRNNNIPNSYRQNRLQFQNMVTIMILILDKEQIKTAKNEIQFYIDSMVKYK